MTCIAYDNWEATHRDLARRTRPGPDEPVLWGPAARLAKRRRFRDEQLPSAVASGCTVTAEKGYVVTGRNMTERFGPRRHNGGGPALTVPLVGVGWLMSAQLSRSGI
jgi:hypothetical protein